MRPTGLLSTFLAASLTFSVGTPAEARAGSASGAGSTSSAGVEQRYLVTFSAGTDPRTGASTLRGAGARVVQTLGRVFSGAVADMPPQAAAALAQNPRIAVVEPDRQVHLTAGQVWPPWGLDRSDQRALPLDHSFTSGATGAGTTVYVVDTGILSGHRDLTGRVRSGYTAVRDGNGTEDCHGHGTHVAGTVGGEQHGIAKEADLVPVRVLDCNGEGPISGVVKALDWMVADHAAGTPAVANLSLGGSPSSALDSAVRAAVDDGITMVVAAGNDAVDACDSSPARVPAVLTVGATDTTDTRASFSNHGPCLDLFGPGEDIVSAWHTSETATMTLSGTSMAAPHVAGAAAALLQADPSASPGQVTDRLLGSTTPGVVASPGAGSPNRLLWADPDLDVPAGGDHDEALSKTPTTPETTITAGPRTGSFVPRRFATFRYSSDTPSTFTCRLDGSAIPCGTSAVRTTRLGAGTHVFTVAAVSETTGAADATPARRTWTVPRNNTTLRHGSGWVKRRGPGRYLNTFSRAAERRATLTTRVGNARALALVVTSGPGHGRVAVYAGSTLLARVSLSAPHLRNRRVVRVRGLSRPFSGRVRVVVSSAGKPVHVEGLGVATR